MFKEILKSLRKVNKFDNASPERLTVKALEELGELAEAINWSTKYKNTDKTPEEILDCIVEEGVDEIVCIVAILDKVGATNKMMSNQFKKKMKKWKKNLDKKENK